LWDVEPLSKSIDNYCYTMDSTSELSDEAKGTKDKGLAKVKSSRGISARACSAKAMNWTLEVSKAPSTHNANTKDTCDSQTFTRATDA
jgi:hypothetical protein